jgi:hypothetical protein
MFINPQRIVSLSVLISIAAFVFYACAPKKQTVIPTAEKEKLTLDDFSFLKAGISFDEVVVKVGNPEDDIGSGFHIFVYNLQDGSVVLLCFGSLDHIQYASITFPDGTAKFLVLPEKLQTQTP